MNNFRNTRFNIGMDMIVALIVFSGAFMLKLRYQTETIDDLKWIVAPSVKLVEWMTGLYFGFIPGLGYLSEDSTILINKDCSGVNFFIITITLSVVIKLSRTECKFAKKLGWIWVPMLSYAASIAANTTRIRISIVLNSLLEIPQTLMSSDSIHQAEGIFVYVFFIIFYYLITTYRPEFSIPDNPISNKSLIKGAAQ